jgi:hypothetical protein
MLALVPGVALGIAQEVDVDVLDLAVCGKKGWVERVERVRLRGGDEAGAG